MSFLSRFCTVDSISEFFRLLLPSALCQIHVSTSYHWTKMKLKSSHTGGITCSQRLQYWPGSGTLVLTSWFNHRQSAAVYHEVSHHLMFTNNPNWKTNKWAFISVIPTKHLWEKLIEGERFVLVHLMKGGGAYFFTAAYHWGWLRCYGHIFQECSCHPSSYTVYAAHTMLFILWRMCVL